MSCTTVKNVFYFNGDPMSFWYIFWCVVVFMFKAALAFGVLFIIWKVACKVASNVVDYNVFFTTVNQGMQKVTKVFGKFNRILNPGLHFVFWPFEQVHTYQFGWAGIKRDGSVEDHPKRLIDYILTKDDVYAMVVKEAEDKNLLPMTWILALTIRIVDARKALFEIQNWLETLFNRSTPYVRDFSTTESYEKFIQGDMKLEELILARLQAAGIIDEFRDRYGVDIRKLEVIDLDPDAEFRKLTLQKRKGEANADQAVQETAIRVKSSVAAELGLTVLELNEKLKTDADFAKSDEYRSALAFAKNQVQLDRAADKGELTMVRIGNNSGSDLADQTATLLLGGLTAYLHEKGKGGKSSKKQKDAGAKKKWWHT